MIMAVRTMLLVHYCNSCIQLRINFLPHKNIFFAQNVDSITFTVVKFRRQTFLDKMVKVRNYQEMVQSEKISHSKNQGGKN